MRNRSRLKGMRAFGHDPLVYAAARPAIDGRVIELLVERCALAPGSAVLEIGPGTGQLTAGLIAAGASVLAIEPDFRFASHLAGVFADKPLDLVPAKFQDQCAVPCADIAEAGRVGHVMLACVQ